MLTLSGRGNLFMEVGREAIDGETESVAPTPEDIQKLIQTAPKYGLEVRMPLS